MSYTGGAEPWVVALEVWFDQRPDNDLDRPGDVAYDYMDNRHTMPASCEIPLSDVRRWLVDFAITGEPSTAVPLRSSA